MWSLGDTDSSLNLVSDYKGKAKGKGKGKEGKGKDGKDKGGKPSACSCCGAPGHHKGDCYWKDQTCNYCGKTGHMAR
eukprot:1673279-Amphidinium_carterae.1